jgi:hypothetical protein
MIFTIILFYHNPHQMKSWKTTEINVGATLAVARGDGPPKAAAPTGNLKQIRIGKPEISP